MKAGQAFCADVKGRMKKAGRNPEHMTIMPACMVVVGETKEAAQKKRDLLDSTRIAKTPPPLQTPWRPPLALNKANWLLSRLLEISFAVLEDLSQSPAARYIIQPKFPGECLGLFGRE